MSRDPVEAMLGIMDHFLQRAVDLDARARAAIRGDASAADIRALMDMAGANRLRALSCAQAAAPYRSPRLSAVEVAPASQTTAQRFEARISEMDEKEVLAHLKRISDGATLEIVEDAVLSEDRYFTYTACGQTARFATSAADEPDENQ